MSLLPRIGFSGLLVVLLTSLVVAGEKLPAGPPWFQDFSKAHEKALADGKPMFLYFTKTY